jgi:hypothetical protein
LRARLGVAALAAVAAGCRALTPDFNAVIAIEVTLPDSGRVEVADTIRPHAVALDGRGDSTAADFVWIALDTTIAVVDSSTGATVGMVPGTGRLQARVGNLRSNPVTVTVLTPLDSIRAEGTTRDTVVVSSPDSLSDSLVVHAFAPTGSPLSGHKIALAIAFPPGATDLTLIPGDTVRTDASGYARFQLRLSGGTRPDSGVVTATARHGDGTPVAGSPVTYVVEFLP